MKGIVDFHTHVLPGIDDGSRSIEDTLNIGWELLSILPRSELRRISDEFLDKYYIEK